MVTQTIDGTAAAGGQSSVDTRDLDNQLYERAKAAIRGPAADAAAERGDGGHLRRGRQRAAACGRRRPTCRSERA